MDKVTNYSGLWNRPDGTGRIVDKAENVDNSLFWEKTAARFPQ